MKRLEDIPKKTLFEVPDGYFDRLPGVIQARIAGPSQEPVEPVRGYAFKFALSALVLTAVALFFWTEPRTLSAEEVLASIDSEQLVAYLEESELNTEEILEALPLDPDEVDAIQENMLEELNVSDLDMEELVDEYEVNNN